MDPSVFLHFPQKCTDSRLDHLQGMQGFGRQQVLELFPLLFGGILVECLHDIHVDELIHFAIVSIIIRVFLQLADNF